MVDPLNGLPRSCRDRAECYDDPLCVEALLEADGRGDYTECGLSAPFTAADASAVCDVGPPFGEWTPEFMCGRVFYEGNVRTFCSPDGETVLFRISGTVRGVADGEYYTHYGHDYWSGSGGGSGYAFHLSTPLDDISGDRFVDLEPIARTPDGYGGFHDVAADIFFIAGGLSDMSYFVGGGVSVAYDGP
jgi:hypothetical protein